MIIYKIFYKEHQVFDIELTLNESEHSGLYYSDLHILPCIPGVAYYIFENVKRQKIWKLQVQDVNKFLICVLFYGKTPNMIIHHCQKKRQKTDIIKLLGQELKKI